eukprot:gene20521-4402_t
MVLPDTMRCTSTYVAREQGAWFEDELPFLPHPPTAARLRAAAALNAAAVTVVPAAVADAPGTVLQYAVLHVGSTPELSVLGGAAGGAEAVDVVSLDSAAAGLPLPAEVGI